MLIAARQVSLGISFFDSIFGSVLLGPYIQVVPGCHAIRLHYFRAQESSQGISFVKKSVVRLPDYSWNLIAIAQFLSGTCWIHAELMGRASDIVRNSAISTLISTAFGWATRKSASSLLLNPHSVWRMRQAKMREKQVGLGIMFDVFTNQMNAFVTSLFCSWYWEEI